MIGLVNVDAQTLTLTSFTFTNVTRRDDGAVFTCVLADDTVIASLTLGVVCECIAFVYIRIARASRLSSPINITAQN